MEINPSYFAGAFSRTSKTSQFQVDRSPVSESKIRQWIGEHLVVSGSDEKEALIEKLLPAFRKLNNCLPEGLKLIMSKSPANFKIRICESSSSPFSDKTSETGGSTIGATTVSNANDEIMIELYSDSDSYKYEFNDGVFHELLHAVNYLAVKDFGGEAKELSSNQENFEILQHIGENYHKRLEAAIQEYYSFMEMNRHTMGANEKKEGIRKIWQKYKISWGVAERQNEDFSLASMRNASEVFVYGLQAYFNDEKRESLREEEPKLYRLIEEVIIPKIKETARG